MPDSRNKGKRGELELAGYLREYGYDVKRSGQSAGAASARKTQCATADCVGLPGIHIECKRVEHLSIYEAITQAMRDAAASALGLLPAVFHRKNHCEWLVTMRLDDWMQIYREWEAGKQ